MAAHPQRLDEGVVTQAAATVEVACARGEMEDAHESAGNGGPLGLRAHQNLGGTCWPAAMR